MKFHQCFTSVKEGGAGFYFLGGQYVGVDDVPDNDGMAVIQRIWRVMQYWVDELTAEKRDTSRS